MINRDEIRKISDQVKLSNLVVEKDYALGWLLCGINNHPLTKKNWIFKGGTCIKKCYLETYRFSEDLDFSYIGESTPSISKLNHIMSEISEYIIDQSGLEFPKASIHFEIFENPRGSLSVQGGIKYRGPVRPNVGVSQMQRIKIDITLDEPLILEATLKTVKHLYTDLPTDGIHIYCYNFEELFAEKIRALAQRLRPRDLYDVVHLFKQKEYHLNRPIILSTLEKKCDVRKISLPTTQTIENHVNRDLLFSEWNNQLKHQVSNLEGFKQFMDTLPEFFNWLYNK